MAFKASDIVKIMQLRGMGRKTAWKVVKEEFSGDSADVKDFIIELSRSKKFTRFPEYSRADIAAACEKGNRILEESDRLDVKITSAFDAGFPLALKTIDDPPLIINTKGSLTRLNALTGVAIIGTREPNHAGIQAGEHFGKLFGSAGFNVVSGLAKGCDAAGHRGCLAAGGFTTAILAHGLQMVYPKENRALAAQILDEGGVLLSEYFVGVGALSNYFVERDRLQAGLSEATIVIQTGERGGTMHAVRATLKSGKPLAAIKYKESELLFEKTRGNEMLIGNGEAFGLRVANFQEFLGMIGGKYPGSEAEPESELDSLGTNTGQTGLDSVPQEISEKNIIDVEELAVARRELAKNDLSVFPEKSKDSDLQAGSSVDNKGTERLAPNPVDANDVLRSQETENRGKTKPEKKKPTKKKPDNQQKLF